MADEIKKDPYILRDIFQRMELDLISSLKRTFYFHKNQEADEGFQWEQWQLLKLRNLVKYRRANKTIIGEYSVPIENAIEEVLQENFIEGENNVIKAANEVGIILPDEKDMPKIKEPEQGTKSIGDIINNEIKLSKAPLDENFFGVNEKKLKALQDSVKNDFKEAQRSILRQMDDVYRQTIFKSHMYLQSGAATLNKAIDMATKDFLDRGINCIEYKNGNRVNISSYAEMALRTASQRATFLGEGKKRDEWGIHTVVISAHANTCQLCAPWQGKVLIDDTFSHGTKSDGSYPLLSEAMTAGLFHPNCRHTMTTFFPGITKLPEIQEEDKAAKTYKAEQEQRYIERQIRRWKRREAGSTDEDNKAAATAKVKEWGSRLKDHLEKNPELRRDYEREKLRIKSVTSKNIVGLNELSGVITDDGIKIETPTKHLIERAVERGIKKGNIQDALKNPLKVGNIRIDNEGRRSKTYIGEKATVAVNPDNGNIVTVYKTSSQRVRRLKGENKTE